MQGDKDRRLVNLLHMAHQSTWSITSHFGSHRQRQGVHRKSREQLFPSLVALLLQTDAPRKGFQASKSSSRSIFMLTAHKMRASRRLATDQDIEALASKVNRHSMHHRNMSGPTARVLSRYLLTATWNCQTA